MSKTIYVTKVQPRAAEMLVERSIRAGRGVRPGVARIVEALSSPAGKQRSTPVDGQLNEGAAQR